MILDEPTNGLDPQQIIEIRGLIRELGRHRTLILSTHILPEVSQVAERVLILNQGRIVAQGRPEELGQGLQGRQEILVRVAPPLEGKKNFETLEGALRNLPGMQEIRKKTEEDGTTVYHLETARLGDLRGEICRQVVAAGFSLLELQTKLVVSEEGKGDCPQSLRGLSPFPEELRP